MRVSDDAFHLVTAGGERHVYDDEDEAISHLRQNTGDVDAEADDVSVVEVTVDGEDWTIKELPWQQIALRLLQED